MYDYAHIAGERVQAMLMTDELATVITVWCGGLLVQEIDPFTAAVQPGINVPCKDEVKRASLGDYVIRKEDKTFDVVKPNAFKHSYKAWGE